MVNGVDFGLGRVLELRGRRCIFSKRIASVCFVFIVASGEGRIFIRCTEGEIEVRGD